MQPSDSLHPLRHAVANAGDLLVHLRAARDAALREAEAAVRSTTRLTRLLTILSEPAPAERLLDRALSALSELFSADIVVLFDPAGTGSFCPLSAIGVPEDKLRLPLSYADGSCAHTAMATRHPVVRTEIANDPAVETHLSDLGAQTAVWLPVIGTQDARGVLVLARCHQTPFADDDIDLLTAMAYRLALVLEQMQRGTQLEEIVSTGRELGSMLEESGICDRVVRLFPKIMRADGAALLLRDSQGVVTCISSWGFPTGLAGIWPGLGAALVTEGIPLFAQPCRVSNVVAALDGAAAPALDGAPARAPEDGPGPASHPDCGLSVLTIPLRHEDACRTVLLAARLSNMPFPPEAVQIATLYASQVSSALRNAHLYRAVRDELTERKRAEEALRASQRELAQLAYHDSLTGLANQASFRVDLESALACSRACGTSVAVVFLDLDNFKIVNDSLGHAFGNQVLCAVTDRIRGCLREQDTAARLGGDEFTILVREVTELEQVIPLVRRLLNALRTPLRLAGRELFVGASMGIALSNQGEASADDLLRNADLAMYRAKSNGKGCFAAYDAQLNAAAMNRLELEIELRHALDRRELCVHYQPILSLDDGRIREVEALVRWQHPRRGLIPPSQIIPIAEETGLIIELGQWVLEEACRTVKGWQNRHPYHEKLGVCVNLSGRQFQHPDLVREIRSALEQSRLSSSDLTIEITETNLVHDPEEASSKLRALKALGVRIAIDDFGTGYSSLSYLKSFPVDTLKMDRSFVQGIEKSARDKAIAKGIIALGQALNLRVIGEGIANDEQAVQLRELGCHHGQGYLFSAPLSADPFEKLLAQATARGRW